MIESSLWKILAFIMAVILIFVAPIVTIYDRMDSITYNILLHEVSVYTEGIRDNGYISQDSYNMFLDKLADTGLIYDVRLEHYEKEYIPSYDASNQVEGYDIVYVGNYSDDIEALLRTSSDGLYKMETGDLFYIHIENKSPTKGQRIRHFFIGASDEFPIIVLRNGGMVRHESY